MSRNVESLDEQELAFVEAVDEALRRLETVKVPGKTEKDVLLQGEEAEKQTHASMEEGAPTLTSESFTPERGE